VHVRRWVLLAGLICLGAAERHAAAQQYTRQEAGIGMAAETASRWEYFLPAYSYTGPRHVFSGPDARYTWNLSPSLAVEGSVGYIAGYQEIDDNNNGHELLALGGVKAGWRGRRIGFYGKMEPGLSSWSTGLTTFLPLTWSGIGPPPNFKEVNARRTDFTVDLGGVFEAYPTPRTIIRLDLGTTLIAQYDQVLLRLDNSSGQVFLEEIQPGHIAQHAAVELSIAHRFGGVREEQERAPQRSPLDAGVQFSLDQRVHESGAQPILPNRAAGAWLSYNFSRYVSIDVTAFYSPTNDHLDYPQDGGRDLMVVGGLKAGIRRSRMGYFVTARPGMMQFSRTVNYEDFYDNPPVIRWAKTTDFVADVGGAVEVYPARHFLFRADVGDATVSYHQADLRYAQSPRLTFTPVNDYYPPFKRPSIVTQFGVGWRF
jgi:hypothetical protein